MDRMAPRAGFFWILAPILAPLLAPVNASADAKRLYDDLLMKGYDSNVRPTSKHGDSTIISFGIRLSQIVAVVGIWYVCVCVCVPVRAHVCVR